MTENANDIDNSFRFVHLNVERAPSSIFISILNTYRISSSLAVKTKLK